MRESAIGPKSQPLLIRVACCLLAMAVAAGAGVAHSGEVAPNGIEGAVEEELAQDPMVDANNVRVSVQDGIVRLTGTVDHLLASERAARLAQMVKGVTAVVNDTRVEPVETRSGVELARDVREALNADPATDSYEVEVSATPGGVVTLTGTTETLRERELAETVAKSIEGVTSINNQISIEYPVVRSEDQIREEIEYALRWDARVDDNLIEVTVDDTTVTLSGTVGSAAEKRIAKLLARVAGVSRVRTENLEVSRWSRDPDLRGEKYVDKPDEAIEEAVQKAIAVDPRVQTFDINAEVDTGIVTLSGTVDNLKARRSAESDARNTVGVIAVRNHIKVEPAATVSDAKIASRLNESLDDSPVLEPYEIDVAVEDGVARLSGTVDDFYEKVSAGDAAARTKGIVSVDNDLEVRNPDPIAYDPYLDDIWTYGLDWYDYEPKVSVRSDESISASIRDELFWSPFVDGEDIEVSVDNGLAVLEGSVSSASAREAATRNAFEGGATRVKNSLTVKG